MPPKRHAGSLNPFDDRVIQAGAAVRRVRAADTAPDRAMIVVCAAYAAAVAAAVGNAADVAAAVGNAADVAAIAAAAAVAAAATAAAVGILRRLNLRNNAVVTAAGVAAGVCNEVRERHAAENAISAHKNDLQKRCRERALPFTTSYAFFVKV